jgi:DNA replication protein DnaC
MLDRRIPHRIKNAKFPYTKTIYDFNYTIQPSISEQRGKETLTCRYIANGENRILLGPSEISKTHFALSFAIEALTQGYKALFLTTDEVVLVYRKTESK